MKSSSALLFALSLFAAAPLAAAHGRGRILSVNGKVDSAPVFPPQPQNGTIRLVSSPTPNYGASNPALTCGPSSQPAPDIFNVSAGDTVNIAWLGDDDSPWPHNTGPMMTYMTECNGSCTDFDPTSAQWFKIQEIGQDPDTPGQWAQARLMQPNAFASVQLPTNLASGQYLVRHEIIALHITSEGPGHAEYYPVCGQLSVAGSPDGVVPDGPRVTHPGAYSDTDPSIFTQQAFDPDFIANYKFPGPAIAPNLRFDDTTGATNDTSTATAADATSSATASATGAATPAATKQCNMGYRPRKRSRVMRDLSDWQ
jgi:hypothetical protein